MHLKSNLSNYLISLYNTFHKQMGDDRRQLRLYQADMLRVPEAVKNAQIQPRLCHLTILSHTIFDNNSHGNASHNDTQHQHGILPGEKQY